MIIENINGVTVIYSEGINKLTNNERCFFTDVIYLNKNDNISNYEEVGRDIWSKYVDDIDSDFCYLGDQILTQTNSISNLEEVALDTDFRLIVIEIKLSDSEPTPTTFSMFSTVNYNVIGGVQMYDLLKKRIIRNTYTSKNDMQVMLDTYYYVGRITTEQYNELTLLLAEQSKE